MKPITGILVEILNSLGIPVRSVYDGWSYDDKIGFPLTRTDIIEMERLHITIESSVVYVRYLPGELSKRFYYNPDEDMSNPKSSNHEQLRLILEFISTRIHNAPSA